MRLLAIVLLFAASPVLADVSPFKTPSGNIACTIAEFDRHAVGSALRDL